MTQNNGIRQGQEMEKLEAEGNQWEKNGYINERVVWVWMYSGSREWCKKEREYKNIAALNVSFRIFKLSYHANDLPGCLAMFIYSQWDGVLDGEPGDL